MIANKRIWITAVTLAIAAITIPIGLVAQEPDPTAEEGEGTDVQDDEQLANANDQLHFPANMWPKGPYIIMTPNNGKGTHLGTTGIWGSPMGQNIRVGKVESDSPADGKVLPGDFIYGANGKNFPADRDARYHFANAITESETKEAGGKLVLDIRRDGSLIQVPIQLEVMGSFSATTPWNCEKSEKIIQKAEEYMLEGLRPESGYPHNEKYMYDPWHDSVLFLLASGNPKTQGLVRRHIRNTMDDIDEWKSGVKHPPFNTQKGWGIGTAKFLFGEYYHRTGDPSVLPYLEMGGFSKVGDPAQAGGKPQPFNNWTWPTDEPTRYGLHPHTHMYSTMATILAKEAGLEINEKKLLFDLKYLYVKRAEYGWVKYMGYGVIPVQRRQRDAPVEITEEEKRTGRLTAMNGKPPMAAAMFSMVEGYDTAVEVCSNRAVYSYNVTANGHGGIWFNGFWTPIGASHAGPEKFQQFMKGQQWWRELYRDRSGAMWQEGNARGKSDTLGTGFAIHRTIPRKNLRILGAPRSMFGPTAPAYMKEAVAAHRNRDYALAEQLTLKLLADGTVPAEDKERVDHFLDSVKTLKESIEHDLTFTEQLVAKQNYVLASIELSQLKMVVSPDNPRLKAIAKAVEPKMDQIPTRKEANTARYQATLDARKGNPIKEEFEKEVASSDHFIKDSGSYNAPFRPGRREKQVTYPKFGKQELTEWRHHLVKSMEDAPQGWEMPGFDDSSWNKITLGSRMQMHHFNLLRTSFMVNDVNAYETLRFRSWCRNMNDITIYLNGEVVALGSEVPQSMTYDLSSGAMSLLQPGKNTLAISLEKPKGKDKLTFRLIGIRKDGVRNTNQPPSETSNNQRPADAIKPKDKPRATPKLKTHHEEIAYMLGHLKKTDPKVEISGKNFPAIQVHDYLLQRYEKHKEDCTSRELFLERLAFKTIDDQIYYVVDKQGNKTMLKKWMEDSLPK